MVMMSLLSFCYGAHTPTDLVSQSGWTQVPMSQTRPCVECHEQVKYINIYI
jgi:hypothetical protein